VEILTFGTEFFPLAKKLPFGKIAPKGNFFSFGKN
jgi:hypothetical protein